LVRCTVRHHRIRHAVSFALERILQCTDPKLGFEAGSVGVPFDSRRICF